MDHAVDILNRLLAAESGSLIHRLRESNPFVNTRAASDHAIVGKMIADVQRHRHELVEMILSLRGAPAPPRYATELGGVHYLKLSFLMPQVIADTRELVKTYESAGSTSYPETDALIAQILADHKRHMADLERLHAGMAQPAGR
jgi:hypothetical protein